MIFILLAIVILIVSFVIAFISLIREQTKFEKEVNFRQSSQGAYVASRRQRPSSIYPGREQFEAQEEATHEQETFANGKALDQQVLAATQDIGSKLFEPTQIEVPFPWLRVEKEPETSKKEQEREKIEQIQSSINKLVQEKKSDPNQNEMKSERASRLRGEINLGGNRLPDLDKS